METTYYKTQLRAEEYCFDTLYDVMAKANEEKSGDALAGIAAHTARERVAAKKVLAQIPLCAFFKEPAIPYANDEVSRLIRDTTDSAIYSEIENWSVARLRAFLLDEQSDSSAILRIGRGLTSEMIAAVTKLMSNLELIAVASKIEVTAHCNTTIGGHGHLSSRLQPNHPSDNPQGILASVLEGLSYGVGDAVIGLNPTIDTVQSVSNILHLFHDTINKYKIPTQQCVLAHVTTQMKAIEAGAPSDLIFQSIAGSEKGNNTFGISIELLNRARSLIFEKGTAKGPNRFYFETGQGSELSSDSHHGCDQLVMEARCYGLARHYKPFLVNTVVGFIGPEYLYDSKQIIRAGLEDHFMGKLHGLPMGVDVCYTNHAKADQNDMDNLLVLLSNAGCNFFMGIPHADDVMLSYQSTGFHEYMQLRQTTGLKPIREFEQWLEQTGFMKNGKPTEITGDASVLDKRFAELKRETTARIDVGRCGIGLPIESVLGFQTDHSAAVDTVYTDVSDLWHANHHFPQLASVCLDKQDYITNPNRGRILCAISEEWIVQNCRKESDVQLIIGDGLSSKAIESNVHLLLPDLVARLKEAGHTVGDTIFIKHARVNIMHRISELTRSKVVCILIGERPGLRSSKSMSAYMAYNATVGMDECKESVISNIFEEGTPPGQASKVIAELIEKMLKYKSGGTDLMQMIEL